MVITKNWIFLRLKDHSWTYFWTSYISEIWNDLILKKWQNTLKSLGFAEHLSQIIAPQEEGWVFESQPRQTQVVKTGSESSTAKPSAIGVSVTGPRRWPL